MKQSLQARRWRLATVAGKTHATKHLAVTTDVPKKACFPTLCVDSKLTKLVLMWFWAFLGTSGA